MAAAAERPASIIVNWEPEQPVNMMELKSALAEKEVSTKIGAVKQIVSMITNGENLSNLFMTVTQYTATNNDHYLKKLLLLYWEVIDKRGPDGKLKPEMIMFWFVISHYIVSVSDYSLQQCASCESGASK